MKNKALAAAAAAAIGFTVSSLVAPGVAGAWPGTCLPFVGCVSVPVDPRGALPGFGGLPHGLPGMPGMPAIAAPPPMVAPPVVPPPIMAPPVVPVAAPPIVAPPVVAPPVVAPPIVAPPVIPAAAPPVVAPPVVAPPVVPAAAPSSPMPNMGPLEHSVEGLLNAPAPAAPAAPAPAETPQQLVGPLLNELHAMDTAPAATPPPANPVSGLQDRLSETLNGAKPAPAPAPEAAPPAPGAAPQLPDTTPAVPVAAPSEPAPAAPLAAAPDTVGPNGFVNQSTLPEAQAISGLTGAPLTPDQAATALGGNPQAADGLNRPVDTSGLCVTGVCGPQNTPVTQQINEGAPQAGQVPNASTNSGSTVPAPDTTPLTPNPAANSGITPGTSGTENLNTIAPGTNFPIGCEESTSYIGNPACNTPQGVITPGSDSGREAIANGAPVGGTTAPAAAPSGAKVDSVAGLPPGGIPANINGEQGVAADCAYQGYYAQYGDFCASTAGSPGDTINTGSPGPITPVNPSVPADLPTAPATPASTPYVQMCGYEMVGSCAPEGVPDPQAWIPPNVPDTPPINSPAPDAPAPLQAPAPPDNAIPPADADGNTITPPIAPPPPDNALPPTDANGNPIVPPAATPAGDQAPPAAAPGNDMAGNPTDQTPQNMPPANPDINIALQNGANNAGPIPAGSPQVAEGANPAVASDAPAANAPNGSGFAAPAVAPPPDNSSTLTPFGPPNPALALNGATPVSAPNSSAPVYGAPGSPLQPIPNAQVPATPPAGGDQDAYAPNMPKNGPIYKPNGQQNGNPCGGPLAAPCENPPIPAGTNPSTAMTLCLGKGTMGPGSSDCNNLALPQEYTASHNGMNSAKANGTCGYWFPFGNGGIQNPLCTPPCKMVARADPKSPDEQLVDNPNLYKGQVCDSAGAYMPGASVAP